MPFVRSQSFANAPLFPWHKIIPNFGTYDDYMEPFIIDQVQDTHRKENTRNKRQIKEMCDDYMIIEKKYITYTEYYPCAKHRFWMEMLWVV